MLSEPIFKIWRAADVALARIDEALQDVSVMHAWPGLRLSDLAPPASHSCPALKKRRASRSKSAGDPELASAHQIRPELACQPESTTRSKRPHDIRPELACQP